MKPVSTKVLAFPCLNSTVFVCPPNLSAASYRYTSWWVLFSAHRAPIPAQPDPMIATFFLGTFFVRGAIFKRVEEYRTEKRNNHKSFPCSLALELEELVEGKLVGDGISWCRFAERAKDKRTSVLHVRPRYCGGRTEEKDLRKYNEVSTHDGKVRILK